MSKPKFNRDQIKKIALSGVGFVFLLYVYFNFFLGPLNRSRDSMLEKMADKQSKLDSSKSELSKANTLEQQAKSATTRYTALKSLSPEGAPIAWFPPRVKVFFANQKIDKAMARLENNTAFKEPELSGWAKYSWVIDLPQADFATLGQAVAELENTEPLLYVTRMSIHALPDQPEFQQINIVATDIIQKR